MFFKYPAAAWQSLRVSRALRMLVFLSPAKPARTMYRITSKERLRMRLLNQSHQKGTPLFLSGKACVTPSENPSQVFTYVHSEGPDNCGWSIRSFGEENVPCKVGDSQKTGN